MYLKRVEMFGFKSFADKTELEFAPGIAAVVGPNGCGKSNLVDAVRWALGEQSVKALRGSRMEEIIFSGSESRKPLNFAEVSLTFSGASAFLNVDYDEITITRRLFRSGESEYYINKSPCRLKDISELFMDTGVGKDIYSVIGQGRVEEIINSKPEDRREIFEEAAGILKYKLRKKEARRRLEETRENLVRVQDLVFELENQVAPLEAQAVFTRRYRDLRAQIDSGEKQLLSHNLHRCREELARVEKQLQGVTDALTEAAAQGGLREERIHELKTRHQEQLSEREALEQKQNRIARQIEQQEGEIRLLNERESRYRERLEQGTQRHEHLANIINRLQEQQKAVEQELSCKQEALAAAEQQCFSLREQLQQFEKGSLLSEVEERQQRLYLTGTRRQAAETAAQELTRQLDALSRRGKTLEQEEAALTDKLKLVDPRLEQAEDEIRILQEQLTALAKEKANHEQALEKLKQGLGELTGQDQQRREEMHGLKSRLQLLHEQEAGLSGYYRGVREVLQARTSLPGIIGPVVDLLSVDEQYIRAVEAALGGALQFIVTETEAAAKAAIRFLKEGNRGWSTFLPLDTISFSSSGLERHTGWRDLDGVYGRASELVQVDSRYRKVVDYLLASIVICRDLDTASRVASLIKYSCRVISLEGDMINPGGAIRGGSMPRRNAGQPLGRRREIEALEQEREALNKKRLSGEEKISETRRDLERTVEKINRAADRQADLTERLIIAQKAGDDLDREAGFLRERLNAAAASRRSLGTEEAELRRRIAEHTREKEEFLQEAALIEAELAGKKELYQRSLAEKKELEDALTGALVKLNSCQEQEQALKQGLKKIEHDLARPLQEQLEKRQESRESETDLARNKEEQARVSASLEQLYRQSAAAMAELEEHKKQSGITAAGVADFEEAEKQSRNKVTRLEKRERHLAVEQTRLRTEADYQVKRLQELFRSAEPVELENSFDPVECAESIQLLREDLEALGEVNLGAVEELDRLLERINFLQKQQDDLRKGELSLRKVLAEIDQRMEHFFTRSFEQIGENMQQVFSELFEGGQVLLKLTDPSRILDSGIEIIAQPPGKKLQNISLLSTGEKVLTAVALIFAILRHKPAPFYLLDEIESALDDVNLARFTSYLGQASRDAQFILITHRRRTMEEAVVLYGVTMLEMGVSRLVSLKLDEQAS